MPIILPDTRPYPANPVKNSLLAYAVQTAHSIPAAQKKLSDEMLQTAIDTMLRKNHYLELSVAMSMAPDAESYRILLNSLNHSLNANTDSEIQWFALPVVLVAGSEQTHTLPLFTPLTELHRCFQAYPHLHRLTQITWLPNLVHSADLAAINVKQWFAAKQNLAAAQNLATKLPQTKLIIPAGQSVHVVFALGYGTNHIHTDLAAHFQKAALPLMQVWQAAFSCKNLSLFANPLAPSAPLSALTEGSHTRLRMAMDVFAANAIRAIRLRNSYVGVVMAAQQGGNILFGFDAVESTDRQKANQIFTWPLSPADCIANIQQNFLDLMRECQVEHVHLLSNILPEAADLPTYSQAVCLSGHNPLH